MSHAPLELWAGAECTINRVGDCWRDQAVLTGFRDRLDDLDRLASLGTRRVRLPVLWEHVQPQANRAPDFSWPALALARVHDLGMEAIVGLLHHGSGPAHTHLLDDRFPQLFARYARQVAERFPDQAWWTPINEPLTTARFSCLYGVWYPHRRDDESFVRALLNQVQGTVLAMAQIREVNPGAKLLQTDDLGHTRCTPGLVDQAAFDNERRWLAFDLLAGKVHASHPLWDWLTACGAGERELMDLCERPCPPEIVGINAYVTSERFLDERLHLHPPHLHGGNGREDYVDVETARAHGRPIDGFAGRLREAHVRYGLPLAITEVHLGCTREEQMRWLHQAWQAAEQARDAGIDVRGVTAWAAFGTVDWNSLLEREDGHYESGLWDIRGVEPRLTAVGRLAAALAAGEPATHPVLASPGWWQRDLRHVVTPHGRAMALPLSGTPLVIVGNGALADAFERLCHMRGLPTSRLCLPPRAGADLRHVIEREAPWGVIDTTGNTTAPRGAWRRLTITCDGARGASLTHDRDGDDVLSIKTCDLFGPWSDDAGDAPGRPNPTYIPDLVQACLDLLIDGECGEWHLTHGGPMLPSLADALSRYAHDREPLFAE